MNTDALRGFLDAVEGHLSGSRKGEILREIESHVWDRAEALAQGRGGVEPEEADLRRAVEEMGDPSDLAISYSGERHIISPKEYNAFWYFTLFVFAIHLCMLLLATAAKMKFNFFPFDALPDSRLEGAGAALLLLSLAVQAFLFDAGLVLMFFFLLRKSFRRLELPNLTFRVESSTRPSIVRALSALLAGILLCVPSIRDWLFSVRDPAGVVFPLFLPAWSAVVPWILVFLGVALVKDALYAVLHERPLTVGLDLFAAILGTGLFVFLASRKTLLGLSPTFPLPNATLDLLNEVIARIVGLSFILLAAIFAARAVKRFARLRQIWGEAETRGL